MSLMDSPYFRRVSIGARDLAVTVLLDRTGTAPDTAAALVDGLAALINAGANHSARLILGGLLPQDPHTTRAVLAAMGALDQPTGAAGDGQPSRVSTSDAPRGPSTRGRTPTSMMDYPPRRGDPRGGPDPGRASPAGPAGLLSLSGVSYAQVLPREEAVAGGGGEPTGVYHPVPVVAAPAFCDHGDTLCQTCLPLWLTRCHVAVFDHGAGAVLGCRCTRCTPPVTARLGRTDRGEQVAVLCAPALTGHHRHITVYPTGLAVVTAPAPTDCDHEGPGHDCRGEDADTVDPARLADLAGLLTAWAAAGPPHAAAQGSCGPGSGGSSASPGAGPIFEPLPVSRGKKESRIVTNSTKQTRPGALSPCADGPWVMPVAWVCVDTHGGHAHLAFAVRGDLVLVLAPDGTDTAALVRTVVWACLILDGADPTDAFPAPGVASVAADDRAAPGAPGVAW